MNLKGKIINFVGGIGLICAIILPAKMVFAVCCPSGCSVAGTCPAGCVGTCDITVTTPGGTVEPGGCTIPDADGDGFPSIACGGPDCNDFDPTINLAAPERCNNLDDNCDGVADEGLTKYTCKNYSNGCSAYLSCSACPAAPTETCNNKDDDCDGAIDGLTQNCYVYSKGAKGTPGVGVCKYGKQTCTTGAWGTCVGAVYASTEICDNRDNDCDGSTDEGFTKYACTNYSTCTTYSSCTACSAAPTETCDGKDNNCNGSIDEGLGTTTCGVGACAKTVQNCVGGASQTCTPNSPSQEICDGKDNDCDGSIDEGLTAPDATLTQGVCAGAKKVCSGTGGWVNPNYGSDYQLVESWCDGKDNDCNGQTDEPFTTKGAACDGPDTDLCKEGTFQCSTNKTGVTCNDTTGNAVETCNGLDDDCNGSIDETFTTKGQACSKGSGDCKNTGTLVCAANGLGVQCSVTGAPATQTCNDNTACTYNDKCSGGDLSSCGGTAYTCDDGKVCTENKCNGDNTCSYPVIAGNCLINGACYTSGQDNPNNPCQKCDPLTSQTLWTNKADKTTCTSNGLFCDGVEECSAGKCVSPGSPCTDDGKTCTTTCNESLDQCNTIDAKKCLIDGKCWNEGDSPADYPCKECISLTSQTAWTNDNANTCDDGNVCTTNSCSTGNCTSTPVAAGPAPTLAGSLCPGGGVPPVQGNCLKDSDCNDNDPCTTDVCAAYLCTHGPIAGVGDSCTNGLVGACLKNGTKVCQGGNLVCNAETASPGTETCNGKDDDCDGQTDEGLAALKCGVGACANSVEACLSGVPQTCVPKASSAEVCDGIDNDCDGVVDNNPAGLSDSDACTNDACVNGTVTHTAVIIDDGDVCTTDKCDVISGVTHTQITCDDNNACTTNSCSKTAGCQYTAITDPSPGDHLDCEIRECNKVTGQFEKKLKPGFCLINGACVAAGSFNGDNKCQFCNINSPNSWTNSSIDQLCVDSNLCTENDHCDGNGKCVSGTQKYVETNQDKCLKNQCNPSTGNTETVATNENGSCDDGDLCTTVDKCQAGKCVGSSPVVCNDNDQCHGTGSCDKGTGLCSYPPLADNTPCNADSNGCTSGDKCVAGVCQNGGAVDCSAQDDSCNTGTCQSNGVAKYSCIKVPKPDNTECLDGDKCNGTEKCMGGSCQPGTPLDCDDGKVCTKDSCDKDIGCVKTCYSDGYDISTVTSNPAEKFCYNCAPTGCGKNSECDNGNPCDGAETCTAGSCLPGTPPATDDGDKCTIDSCDPASGVVHNAVDMDDHNKCTVDSCEPAVGVIHTPIPVEDDGNVCTTDSCDPALGIQHLNNTGPCDDGNACTENDMCSGGKCIEGNKVDKDKDGHHSIACGGDDCNDNDSTIFAGNPEVCDGKDNDCNGVADDGLGRTTCGVGACQTTVDDCKNGVLQSCIPLGAAGETCDGVDNDCDGTVDEGLGNISCGVGECAKTVPACINGVSQICTPKDSSAEVCDGKDNDCDEAADEDLGTTTCGVGECAKTVQNCVGGIPQTCTPFSPKSEICDGKDNNCDGTVDNNSTDISDNNVCTTDTCVGGAIVHTPIGIDDGNECTTDTCDPVSGPLHVSIGTGQMKVCTNFSACGSFTTCEACETRTETCNGLDDDCNGTVDDNYNVGQNCTKEILGCQIQGVTICDVSSLGSSCNATASDSDSDGIADQCDTCPNNPEFSKTYNGCGGCTDLTIGVSCGDCGTFKCDGKDAQKCAGDITKPCNDNDACTEGDHCGETGLCVSGMPKNPDDGNPCTIDSCDKVGGERHEDVRCEQTSNTCKEKVGTCNKTTGQCEFTNNTAQCEDGNRCTENDRCSGGSCVAGTAKVCSDNLTCTADTCDSNSGECKFNVTSGCLIEGVCYEQDSVNSAETCQVCNSTANNKGWSARNEGLACTDDSDKCTSDICVTGICKHQPLGDGKKECYAGPSGTKDVGECKHGTSICTSGDWQACTGEILPVAELCDEKDNDCDGLIDENFANKGQECSAGSNTCAKSGKYICSPDKTATVCNAVAKSPSPEVCNGMDDDCDGAVDEDLGKITCGTGQCMNSVEACAGGVPQTCTPLACDDGNNCTENDRCDTAGNCFGDELKCDDKDSCTTDSCDMTSGCVYNEIAECKSLKKEEEPPPAIGKGASRIFDLTKTRAVYIPFNNVTNVTVVGDGEKQVVLVEGVENGINRVAMLQMSKFNKPQDTGVSGFKAVGSPEAEPEEPNAIEKPEFGVEAKKDGIKIAGFNNSGDRFTFSDKCIYEVVAYVDQVASGKPVDEFETCLPEDQVCAGYKILSVKLDDANEDGSSNLTLKVNCPSENGDIEKTVNLASQAEKNGEFALNVADGVGDVPEDLEASKYLPIEDKKFDKEIVKEDVKAAFGDEFVNDAIEKTTVSGEYESIDKVNLLVGGLYSVRVGVMDNSADEYKAMSELKLTPYDVDVENNICSSVIDGIYSGPDASFIMPKFLNRVAMKNYSKPDLLAIAELVAKEDIVKAINGEPYESQAAVAFFFFNANEAPTVKINSPDEKLIEKSVTVLPGGGLKLVADGFDQTNDELKYEWSCEDNQGADCSILLSQREGKEVEFHETPFDEPQVKGVDLSVNAAPPEKSFGTVVFDYPLSVTVKAIDPGGLDGKDVISIGADGAKAISQGEEATDVIGGGGDVLGGNPWWTTIGGGGCSLIIR